MTDRTVLITQVDDIPALNNNDTITHGEYTGTIKLKRELENTRSSNPRHPTIVYKTENHFFIYREVTGKKNELEIITHE